MQTQLQQLRECVANLIFTCRQQPYLLRGERKLVAQAEALLDFQNKDMFEYYEKGDDVETIKLATYGTLKSGHDNHEILGPDAKVLARGIRIPNMSLYAIANGWYPGAVRDEEGFGVEVEVVEVPVSMLRVIDNYEGYYPGDSNIDSLFNREAVTLPNGEECVMYLYNRLPNDRQGGYHTLIPSGKWEDSFSEEAVYSNI